MSVHHLPAGAAVGLALTALALVILGGEAHAQSRSLEGRWRAEERCEGDSAARSFVLSSDGSMLTARLPGSDVNSFGAIIGFTPLLPGGRFSIDISLGGSDAKSTYTGRVRDNRTITADGGAWSGSNFRPCRLSATWLGTPPAAAQNTPARPSGRTTAGRPEPITGPTAAGRPESIPRSPAPSTTGKPEPAPPVAAPPFVGPPAAQAASLPPCEDEGPPPSALGADGVWRPTCARRGAATSSRPAATTPPPPTAPAAAPPARPATPPAGSASSEADQLRRQLEEERQRREAAERALRLNEALGRQGRN